MRVDFYILAENKPQARYPYACRIIDKAHQQGHRIHVHTDSALEAHLIDDLLWTFRDDSFIPHQITSADSDIAVTIDHQDSEVNNKEILINLAKTIPAFIPKFQRIIEIVPEDVELKTICREHYRYYQQQGNDIKTHKII